MAIFIDDGGLTDALRRTTALPSETACTMMGWFKLITRTDYGTFLALVSSGSTGNMVQLDASGTNQIGIWSQGGFTTGTVINSTQWYHMAFVMERLGAGDDLLLYLDGVLDASRATATPTMIDMYIGSDNIDEGLTAHCAAVKIWDAVLTPAEIRDEMWTYVPQRMANIHLWSPLLDTGGTTFADYSPAKKAWTEEGTITHIANGPPIGWARGRGKIIHIPAAGEVITVDKWHRSVVQPVPLVPEVVSY